MIISPVSFNGTSILTGTSTDYDARIPRASALLQQQTDAMYVKRAGATPVYSGKNFQPHTIVLEIEAIHDFMTVFESLNQLFDTGDETPRQLIVQDTEDSNKQYYIYATPTQVQGGHDGPMATVSLAVDDPIWQSVTLNSQTFSTTTTTGTTDVVVNGNAESYPIFEITPATQPSTDYLYSLPLQVLPNDSASSWHDNYFLDIVGSSDTTFDTAALVAGGKMQADGDDLRVFCDGVEIDRWLDGINTTDTHVFVVADMRPPANMTLKTAFVSTDTVTEIEIDNTSANRAHISFLPNSGRLIVDASLGSTDTEEFTYTARTVSATKLAFTIHSRSVRTTSAFDHAAGANVRFLLHDYTIVYGNASATAPTVDNTRKPIQALTSRNSSWTYTNFTDTARRRAGIWYPGAVRTSVPSLGPRTHYYTSTNDAGDTDPATAMGLAAQTFESGGIWRSDTVSLSWLGGFYNGISSVAASGDQYQNSSSWPFMGLQVNNPNGPPGPTAWTTLWSISAQPSTDYSTWTTWSKASSDATIPSGAIELRWLQEGTILGTTDYSAKGEISSITVGILYPPHVMIRAETNNNKLDFTLTNATTGESMRVIYPIGVASTLIIDTDPEFPTAKSNGQIVNGTVFLSSIRSKWLRMTPGTNTINFDNNLSVASDISIVIKWRDRQNFF